MQFYSLSQRLCVSEHHLHGRLAANERQVSPSKEYGYNNNNVWPFSELYLYLFLLAVPAIIET